MFSGTIFKKIDGAKWRQCDLRNKCPSKHNSYLFGTVFNFRTRTCFFNVFLPFLFYNPRTNNFKYFPDFMSGFNISIIHCKRICVQVYEMPLLQNPISRLINEISCAPEFSSRTYDNWLARVIPSMLLTGETHNTCSWICFYMSTILLSTELQTLTFGDIVKFKFIKAILCRLNCYHRSFLSSILELSFRGLNGRNCSREKLMFSSKLAVRPSNNERKMHSLHSLVLLSINLNK